MAITVYWSSLDPLWVMQREPDSVNKNLKLLLKNSIEFESKKLITLGTLKCPAIADELQNTFNMYSVHDYEFEITSEDQVKSEMYDQNYFNNHVLIRSIPDKLFSFNMPYVFFTPEKSLEMSYCLFPFLENNNITQRCIPIPGKFNIGKWFRATDFAFFLKDDFKSFKIERDEVFCYVKFNTQEKINLVQFNSSNLIREYLTTSSVLNKFVLLRKLENYYKMFKLKKMILKEIENNIL
jgi:hypothetical protein